MEQASGNKSSSIFVKALLKFFSRWLVHSIASYYGLRTWSITVGDPARREAYVGIKQMKTSRLVSADGELPRPLWCMV